MLGASIDLLLTQRDHKRNVQQWSGKRQFQYYCDRPSDGRKSGQITTQKNGITVRPLWTDVGPFCSPLAHPAYRREIRRDRLCSGSSPPLSPVGLQTGCLRIDLHTNKPRAKKKKNKGTGRSPLVLSSSSLVGNLAMLRLIRALSTCLRSTTARTLKSLENSHHRSFLYADKTN